MKKNLDNIDDLFTWLYDNNILNKTDKKEKDSIFYQYYRYYNDGDFPRSLIKRKGVYSHDPKEKIKKALEEVLREFISRILFKYHNKYNRQDYYDDIELNNYKDLLNIITKDVPDLSLYLYFYKKYKTHKSYNTPMLNKLFIELENKYSIFRLNVPEKYKGYTLPYIHNELTKNNEWEHKTKAIYKEIIMISKKIIIELKFIIDQLETAKKPLYEQGVSRFAIPCPCA